MIFNKGPKMQSPHGYKEFPAKKNPRIFIIIAVIVVALVCAGESFYSVKEQEQAILTMFGQVLRVDTAGLYFKIPFIQDVHTIDMTTQAYLPHLQIHCCLCLGDQSMQH